MLSVTSSNGSFRASQTPAAGIECRPDGALVRLPELPEASGVAAGRRNPQRGWSHNDSSDPVLVMLDERGAIAGRVRLTGATVEDWEAIGAGPCPSGSCLYVGDIGDNDAERKRITIYRVPEPLDASGSLAARDAFHMTYPDGPHDAETLLVSPQGEIYIVTKGETGPVAMYQVPRDARAGSAAELTPVGKPRASGKSDSDARITDGAISPNGAWVVLRSNRALYFYAMADLLAGNWREAGRVDLGRLGEPQGEGVAFADATTLYLVGEGGGKGQPGTFVRMTCTF